MKFKTSYSYEYTGQSVPNANSMIINGKEFVKPSSWWWVYADDPGVNPNAQPIGMCNDEGDEFIPV